MITSNIASLENRSFRRKTRSQDQRLINNCTYIEHSITIVFMLFIVFVFVFIVYYLRNAEQKLLINIAIID